MADLAQLQGQLDKLRALRARGVRSASYDGESVEFRSDAELASAINAIEGQIAAAQAKPAVQFATVRSTRGW